MSPKKIEEYGKKFMKLRNQFSRASEKEIPELEARYEELMKGISQEDEQKILDWIDEQQYLIDMVRGGTDVFDENGNYRPVSYR